MNADKFIKREIATWGEDYIFSLIDRGFEPVLVFNSRGAFKWTWKMPQSQLSRKSRESAKSA